MAGLPETIEFRPRRRNNGPAMKRRLALLAAFALLVFLIPPVSSVRKPIPPAPPKIEPVSEAVSNPSPEVAAVPAPPPRPADTPPSILRQSHRTPAMREEAPAVPAETSELVIFLRPGVDPKAFAARSGLALKYTLRSNPDAHV